ncbi:glycosyltransferase family protein [Geomicrobium sediminis]|uniref:Glycosyltransferase involved in cell wall biosynthesis n=1 Tax=Geomicrobium sediminis TaxID=1347788 RepID=A0ABS2P9Y5_9BACL|nr:glycosyltransferase involved in cell wall biosynthesis [Geomicrobium sediminis]
MKLLFIARDTSSYIDRNYHYLEKALRLHCDQFATHRTSGHIAHILNGLTFRPDFILVVNDLGGSFFPRVRGLRQCQIPTGLIVNDVHRHTKLRESHLQSEQYTAIFSVVHDAFQKRYPSYADTFHWLPHFVNTNLFYPGEMKRYDLLLTGAVNETYPFRQAVKRQLEHDQRFHYLPHPGYQSTTNDVAGAGYAKRLREAKISFACPSIYEYPVKKYYEILASQTLLLAPVCEELLRLGFVPGKHFVEADHKTVAEQAYLWLEDEQKRKEVARAGSQFVYEQHSLKKRVNQLLTIIKKEVNKYGKDR